MPALNRPLALLLTLFSLLAGCATVHYEYQMPESEEGRACVRQCQQQIGQCRQQAALTASWEQLRCERQNDFMRRRCLSLAGSREEAARCGMYQQFCWFPENTYGCTVDYHQCFVQCGGRIHTYEE